MNTDPWGHTLRMLQPDIDTLKEFMDRGPKIRPVLKLVKRTWVLEIKADWGIFKVDRSYETHGLDERVVWTTCQLENWKNVSRQAWNMWHFKHKRDAEKFITLYNLVWTE
jgi:hypothetical protein